MEKKDKEPKIINNLEDLESLIKLARNHKVDLLEVEGHKIVISRHNTEEVSMENKSPQELEEEELFWSSQN